MIALEVMVIMVMEVMVMVVLGDMVNTRLFQC